MMQRRKGDAKHHHERRGRSFQLSTQSELIGREGAQPVVLKLEESDDTEQYLTTEYLEAAYHWPEVDWTVRLIPYMTRKA